MHMHTHKGSTAAAKVNSFLTFMKIFTEHFSAICLNFAVWSKHLSQRRLYVLGTIPHRGLGVALGSKSQIRTPSPRTRGPLLLRHRLTAWHRVVPDSRVVAKGLCKYPQPSRSPSLATLCNKGTRAPPNLNTKPIANNDSSGERLVWGSRPRPPLCFPLPRLNSSPSLVSLPERPKELAQGKMLQHTRETQLKP